MGEPNSERLSQYKPNHNNKERLTSSKNYNVHQQDQQHQALGDLQWNDLTLTLQPFHYVNGQLNLRCIVEIPQIYNATSELQLGAGLREPVPERGELNRQIYRNEALIAKKSNGRYIKFLVKIFTKYVEPSNHGTPANEKKNSSKQPIFYITP